MATRGDNNNANSRPQPREREDQGGEEQSLFSYIIRLVFWPYNFLISTLIRLNRAAVRLLGPAELPNPINDIESFKESFESKFGIVHPRFFQGSYAQALEEAKRELKFLLVYLHSPHHQDTEEFCREVITHPNFVSFIQEKNVLFWSCSIGLPEGSRVSLALRERAYPYLALIVLKDNRMTVVQKIEGFVTLDRSLAVLSEAITDNEASLVVVRAERETRNMNQMIRQQQDLDYEESLRQDRQKEKEKQEEKRKKEEAERNAREEETRLRQRHDNLMKLKKTIHIEPEPDAKDVDVVHILAKLPDGTGLKRHFKKTQSIRHLFMYVYSHPSSPLQFQITTNFPRKVLPCQCPTLENENCLTEDGKEPPSFGEIGLDRSVTLFVNDLEA